MMTRGETVQNSAEGASTFMCESLRQKDSCWTQLWRAFPKQETTKGESRSSVNFQVQGQRKLLYEKGFFCPFFMG